MKRAAKLILSDKDNKYLLLYRTNHPIYPYDADLAGGAVEENEEPVQGLLREVHEETQLILDPKAVELVQKTDKYNKDYIYYLFETKCENQPNIIISPEHSRYEWVELNELIEKARTAADNYMHMVADYLSSKDRQSLFTSRREVL